MRTFNVKSEYHELWGSTIDSDTIVTESDIILLAREWDTSVEELMSQLVEI